MVATQTSSPAATSAEENLANAGPQLDDSFVTRRWLARNRSDPEIPNVPSWNATAPSTRRPVTARGSDSNTHGLSLTSPTVTFDSTAGQELGGTTTATLTSAFRDGGPGTASSEFTELRELEARTRELDAIQDRYERLRTRLSAMIRDMEVLGGDGDDDDEDALVVRGTGIALSSQEDAGAVAAEAGMYVSPPTATAAETATVSSPLPRLDTSPGGLPRALAFEWEYTPSSSRLPALVTARHRARPRRGMPMRPARTIDTRGLESDPLGIAASLGPRQFPWTDHLELEDLEVEDDLPEFGDDDGSEPMMVPSSFMAPMSPSSGVTAADLDPAGGVGVALQRAPRAAVATGTASSLAWLNAAHNDDNDDDTYLTGGSPSTRDAAAAILFGRDIAGAATSDWDRPSYRSSAQSPLPVPDTQQQPPLPSLSWLLQQEQQQLCPPVTVTRPYHDPRFLFCTSFNDVESRAPVPGDLTVADVARRDPTGAKVCWQDVAAVAAAEDARFALAMAKYGRDPATARIVHLR
ncbi:hypothetical protein BC828DRAFT_376752 [Blastocladiella britannica]|nr:hypothetical protein BC828DRAFT_376752 [Blastocladiella britannica]